MDRRIFYISLLSASISACSNVGSTRQANGDFDYVKTQEAQEVIVPDGLSKPRQYSDYEIAENVNLDGPTGDRLDIRAPALIIPIAAGSRVEPGNLGAKIWFDQVNDEKDLQLQVYQAMTDYLKEAGIEFTVSDLDALYWESDWFHYEHQSGSWLWAEIDRSESTRFSFKLERKPHGRSVALSVKVIDYMKTTGSGATKSMDPVDRQRAEIGMVNAITAQLDYQYRLDNQQSRAQRANLQMVTVGEASDGSAAYVVDLPLSDMWSNMPIFFEKYNFKITDLDESGFVYKVNYNQLDSSFWDSIWGDAIPVIKLPDGDYEFKLSRIDNKTAISLFDDQGRVINQQTLNDIFDVMGPALSFN